LDIRELCLEGHIDHTFRGRKVRLHGVVQSLNEDDRTCSMKFDNGVLEHGIPMECVQINEMDFDKVRRKLGGAMDAVKSGLGKLGSMFKQIGGYLRTLVNGEPAPVVNAVMIGQYAEEGSLPEDVTYLPSEEAIQAAEENGISIGNHIGAFQETPEELEEINAFWRDVVDNADEGDATMESLKDSYLRAVNEQYGYKAMRKLVNSGLLEEFFVTKEGMLKELNEAITEIPNFADDNLKNPGASEFQTTNRPIWGVRDIVAELGLQLRQTFKVGNFAIDNASVIERTLGKYLAGMGMTREELDDPENATLKQSLMARAQRSAKQESKAVSSEKIQPLLIWGAPGIGKTAITNQVIATFNMQYGQKSSILDVPLASKTEDSFFLPAFDRNQETGDTEGAKEVPATWLPMYLPTLSGDPAEDAVRDMQANHRMKSSDYKDLQNKGISIEDSAFSADGGIIFFDELLRASEPVMNVIMKLVDEHALGEYKLGSHWIISSASNRPYDMNDERTSAWEDAYARRFKQCTFVPKLRDWLMWAKGYNIDLETGNWERTASNDPRIEQNIIDFIESRGSSVWFETLSDDQLKVNSKKRATLKANPASWEKVSNAIIAKSRDKFGDDWSDDSFDPKTGEMKRYSKLSDDEIIRSAKSQIGSGSAAGMNVMSAFIDHFHVSGLFTDAMCQNIWKHGCIDPKRPEVKMPNKLNGAMGRQDSNIRMLIDRLFEDSCTPMKFDQVSTPAQWDKMIKAFVNFYKFWGDYFKQLEIFGQTARALLYKYAFEEKICPILEKKYQDIFGTDMPLVMFDEKFLRAITEICARYSATIAGKTYEDFVSKVFKGDTEQMFQKIFKNPLEQAKAFQAGKKVDDSKTEACIDSEDVPQ